MLLTDPRQVLRSPAQRSLREIVACVSPGAIRFLMAWAIFTAKQPGDQGEAKGLDLGRPDPGRRQPPGGVEGWPASLKGMLCP